MAVVRRSLDEIKASRPKPDFAKLRNMSEAQIERQAVEDGEDQGAELAHMPVFPPQAVRKQLRMTQEQFAAALRIPLATLRNWEQGRTMPDPAARALLAIVAKEPERALRALEPS